MTHDPLDLRAMLADEIVARRESGHVVAALDPERVAAAGEAELRALIAAVEGAPRRPDWPYDEPADVAQIASGWPRDPPRPAAPVEERRSRLHGAWLGRCAGCALGKPVEMWPRTDIRRYLERTGDYPLTDYVPAGGPAPAGFPPLNPSWPEATRGSIAGMPRDDDIDYTMLGLHVLETHGHDFGTEDVAAAWLRHFPFTAVFTAERAAYRNLILGLRPPATATHVNPYREWIGAQIRVDAYAYANPGAPAAARQAATDARLSHTGNGLYGAVWAAALIAASFSAPSMADALATALAFVPARSRLAEALREVAALRAAGHDWEAARDALEVRHGALSPVHTINNAAVVAAALLWGEGDFTRTIGLAVQGGWDTDCNGATAGSAFGAMHGVAALPEHWVAPLEDRVRSALYGFDGAQISALAERTLQVQAAPGDGARVAGAARVP